MAFASATEYVEVKKLIDRFSSSVNTDDPDLNDVIDDMVFYLEEVTDIGTYQEDYSTDVTERENFKHRRVLAWLVIWDMNRDVGTNTWERLRLHLIDVYRKTKPDNPYWDSFLEELNNLGFSVSIQPDWPMKLSKEYDHDDYDVTREKPTNW